MSWGQDLLLSEFQEPFCSTPQGLQDLNLVNLLILVLVLVLPEADICLHLSGNGLGQDPPSMTIHDSIRQGRIVHQALQVADRRLNTMFDASEGQVEM